MKKPKMHLQFFLMFLVATTVIIIFMQGFSYFGKSSYDTSLFDNETHNFMDDLSKYVLNPLTEEDKSEILKVTDEEVEYYRTYYGSLSEQIQNVKDQYEMDSDGSQDAEVVAAIKKERDAKIAKIRKNFEDDEYVKEKILKQKKKALEVVFKNFEQSKRDFLRSHNYFAYSITNEKTGEVFSEGNVNAPSTYTFEMNRKDQYMPSTVFSIYLNEGGEDVGLKNDSYEIEKDNSHFYGKITIPNALLSKTDFGKDIRSFNLTKNCYYVLMVVGFIGFVLLMTVLQPTKAMFVGQSKMQVAFERLPVDLALFVIFCIGLFTTILIDDGLLDSVRSMTYNGKESYAYGIFEWLACGAMAYFSFIIVVHLIVWTWHRITNGPTIENIWPQTVLSKFVNAGIDMFSNRAIGIQMLILLVVVYLGGFGLAVVVMSNAFEVLLFYMLLFVVFLLPTLFIMMRRMGYLNRIMRHTKDMAEGRLTNDLAVKGKSPFAKHAKNLNKLREGVRSSVTEQAKSERLKTELITNVSHDLRTPLTSIITYTDLLKNPAITDDERAKYIAILDAKSARLKTLIEDLFEVSKMASGNIEISKQRIDLAQLLQQATGEHGEDFAAANLDLRVNIAEQPLFAYVDGQKWWRVIDNLIINARKYSLEGTRVYVNLKSVNGEAELTVKNVAKHELNEDATELVERFKRADTSRNTEGSGLGLAIAQSIVDIHGGHMEIAVDGDLFKVTVYVRADK